MASTQLDIPRKKAKPDGPFDVGAVALSFLDQGLHSLASLILSAVLIVGTDPATFGRFALISGCTLIAASLHYGAIGIPLLVHVRQTADAQRLEKIAILHAVDLRFRLASALIIAAVGFWASGDVVTAAAGAAFAAAWLARETRRNLFYLEADVVSAARLGAASFVLLLISYSVLFYISRTETAALLASALSTSIALWMFRGQSAEPAPRGNILGLYRSAFPGAGWSVINSATNEAQTRLHVLTIPLFRSVDQLGLVEAGRILWAPLQLLGSAWQRIAQPRIAGLVQAGEVEEAKWLTGAGIGLMVAATSIWAGAICLFWPLIENRFYSQFPHIGLLVAGWGAVSLLILSNWSLVVFLNAHHRFRTVAMIGMAAAASTAFLLAVLAFGFDISAALVVMATVQIGVLISFLIVGLRGSEMRVGRSRS